ncbi:MFS transporter [Paenibacillus chitinolyticus]|uniref:MFS transporter n=1 Tax=Paenibacillus chitinolyticus TaxID=79263 RepID=UPI00362D545D
MNKRVVFIMLLMFTVYLGFGLIIPVLPELLHGIPEGETHLGWVLSIYSIMSFLVSPLWGGLSDKIGRRPVLLTGIFGFMISFVLLALAGTNLPLLYLSRILGGICSGALSGVALAYVADITTHEERTKSMGFVGMSIGLGFIFGPAIGGTLSVVSLSLPFWGAALLSAGIFCAGFLKLKESLPDNRGQNQGDKPSRWSLLRGNLGYLYVMTFFVTFSLAGLEATFQYFQIARFGVTPLQIGLMFMFSGFADALVQGGLVRVIAKKKKEKLAILCGLFASAVGFLLVLGSDSFWTATLALTVFSAGNAMIRPCINSLLTQRTRHGQGVTTGLSSSMDSLGRIAGPITGTSLFGIQHGLPFAAGAVVSVLASLLLLRFSQLDRESKDELPGAV